MSQTAVIDDALRRIIRTLVPAIEDAVRADERQKTAEGIAKAVEADCRARHNRPDGDPCVDEDCDRHAAIARQHAGNGPRIAVEAPTAHAESHRMGEGSDGAQEAVG